MLSRVRNLTAALVLSSAVIATPVAEVFAAPAATPIEQVGQAGLVNVSVIEGGVCVICDAQVAVPVALQLAANVCGVGAQVGVIAQQLQRTGQATCTNTQTNRTFSVQRA